jgi:cytochrome c
MLLHALACAVALTALAWTTPATASDPEALMKRSGCFKCHAVDRVKLGPGYQDVAAKYRASPDAEQRLFIHLTTNPRISVDGQEAEHVSMPRASEAEVRAVARWILSR